MDIEIIEERWESIGDSEFLGFEKVQNKRSNRPDLHAFILLDRLFPDKKDIVSAAEHDKIYLDIEDDQISLLSDDEIIELSRCGVMYDGENHCLCMFA